MLSTSMLPPRALPVRRHRLALLARTVIVAVLGAAAVVGAPVAGNPAAAAEPTASADVNYQAGAATGGTTWKYGATLPVARRIPIGAESTQIRFSHPLTVASSGVQCSFRDSAQNAPEIYKVWSSAEWASADVHSFDIPAGMVVAGSFRVYRFGCRTGVARYESPVWNLKESATAPSVVELSDDESKLTSASVFKERQGGRIGEPRTVHEGDRIVVSGEAGAWPLPADSPVLTGEVRPFDSDRGTLGATVPLDDIRLSDDGSEISGRIPTGLADLYFGVNLATTFAAKTSVPMTDTTPGRQREVRWATTVIAERVVVQQESTTTMSLSRRVAFDSRPATVTVTVTATAMATATAMEVDSTGAAPSGDVPSGTVPSGGVPSGDVPSGTVPSGDVPSGTVPSGTVEILADGAVVTSATLTEAGTATATIPPLPRGKHQITARYLGDTTVAPSESSVAHLFVISRGPGTKDRH